MLESLFNKETPTQVFTCEYCEIFKNNYLEEHMRSVDSNVSNFKGLGMTLLAYQKKKCINIFQCTAVSY